MTFWRFVRRVSQVVVSLLVLSGSLAAVIPAADAAYKNPGVLKYGAAPAFGNPTAHIYASVVVGMAATSDGQGYWLVTAGGAVSAYGDAIPYGDMSHASLYAPILGIVATPDGHGYWLYAMNGQIYHYGDAGYFGSAHGVNLHGQIVGMAATPDGQGYWMLSSSGRVAAYGDAVYYGGVPGKRGRTVVGIIADPTAAGYWIVTGGGGVYPFGNARFFGSLAGVPIAGWVVSMAATPDGQGYWLANANGDVYHFGDAKFLGDNLNTPRTEVISEIVADPAAPGYWLVEPDAFPTTFGQTPRNRIVAVAAAQIKPDPDTGYFCNPYGPCEAWCALFATWVWRHAGVGIPSIPFVGNIYNWARRHTRVLPPNAMPRSGDIILYGTGPWNVNTAVHTGIVAQVWPDGAMTTIEGDSGPAPRGAYNVTINGPFTASQSIYYNGTPVFGFAVP